MIIKRGFGLIEVLVSVLVLGISSVALVQYQRQQVKAYEEVDLSKRAVRIANNELEVIASRMKSSPSPIACPDPHTVTELDTEFVINCVRTDVINGATRYTVSVNYSYRGEDQNSRYQKLSRLVMAQMGSGVYQ
ncbi:prepilin-type N-terminal cleavage/methylation domain-containing protein [Plesiomonas shigelloides]|uniref:type IV pilus modification PilV family protein n=1 Tax=Plesiomonas shigelloides TaxID=703 RepID=UPI0022476EA3|nr:prepilin-type N-terminal cleavage/methylation domain-containing protein [Plesiomonas shigelloides]MCX2532314.1 prepilin-type N-terminal cleavage/methylation domain-containing protein [Plesiomonas shigelloides]